ARRKIALADLRNEPWILCPPQQAPGFCTHVATACATAGFVPQVAQHAVQMSTILGLVAGHLGVCVVPASLVKRRADLAFRPLTGPGTPINYDLGAVWRGDGLQPALMAFLETIRTVMRHRPVRTN